MKPILLAAVAAFAAVQLLQPTISNAHATGESNLLADPALDPRVRSTSYAPGADCHSNRVRLPWYCRVSPFSWMIARHIEQGRDKLNFSDWPRNSANEKQDIADSVEKGEMPFAPYLLLHRQARISEEDRESHRTLGRLSRAFSDIFVGQALGLRRTPSSSSSSATMLRTMPPSKYAQVERERRFLLNQFPRCCHPSYPPDHRPLHREHHSALARTTRRRGP